MALQALATGDVGRLDISVMWQCRLLVTSVLVFMWQYLPFSSRCTAGQDPADCGALKTQQHNPEQTTLGQVTRGLRSQDMWCALRSMMKTNPEPAAHAVKDQRTINLIDGTSMAGALAISPRTLARLRRSRTIPFTRIGRLVRYNPAAVSAALAEYEVKSRHSIAGRRSK